MDLIGECMKKLLILAFVLSFVGCTGPTNHAMDSWMGHNFNELIASWGPPDNTFSDGRGGQIFIYTRTRSWIQPGSATTTYSGSTYGNYTYGQATTVYSPSYVQGYTAYRMFWMDSSGTIYSWAWRGL
jgi:hypothetical protein